MRRRCLTIREHRRRSPRAVHLLAGLVFCAANLSACAQTPAIPAGSVHFSDQLKQIMRRMNTLIYERNQTELELDRERLTRARELAASASALAAEAGAAEDSASALDDAERREFTRLAHALAAEATVLDELAAAGRYGELSAQMQRVGHQCAACHLRFRVRTP